MIAGCQVGRVDDGLEPRPQSTQPQHQSEEQHFVVVNQSDVIIQPTTGQDQTMTNEVQVQIAYPMVSQSESRGQQFGQK